MSVLYKQPAATKVFFIEFSNQLVSGDSLASLTSVSEATAAITIASTSITGTKVQGTYSGGVDGTTYTIVATVVTTNGETLELEVFLRVIDTPASVYTISYFTLLERVGHFLFGLRSGLTGDNVTDCKQCIDDGLRDVYSAHSWSFFRPITELTTTAPYSTGTIVIASGVVTLTGGTFPAAWAAVGVLKHDDNYYDVDTYDSATQLTLEDTSVTDAVATTFELGRPEYALDSDFEAVANDSDLHYEPGQADWYPPVRQRHDANIRRMSQESPYYDRPIFYSVRTVEFDATVGSRKRLAFHPIPDAAYVLKVPMILRPIPVDETNLYPVGGEILSQLITESCLAAAERNFDEGENQHTKRFQELLPLAIRDDLERSTPTQLGPDSPRGEGYHGVYDADHHARAVRMGSVTLDGTIL